VTFISYAQNFEDVMLWRALKNVTGGFYIDVGASHPDNDSVTKAFYQRGWHGINVEPVPASAHLLRVARPRDLTLQVAVGDAPGLASLFVVTVENNTGLSTLSEAAAAGFPDEFDVAEVQTEIRTLASICEEAVHGPIHFLKIDAEQAERAVLQGADFARFRPWIVLVEATAPMSVTETHGEWDGILLAADYHFVWFDGLNRFYVSAEKRGELAHAFKIQPNVFDGFIRPSEPEWARLVSQAETEKVESAARAEAAEDRANSLALRLNAIEAAKAEVAVRAAIAEDRANRLALRATRDAASHAELERMYRDRTRERHALANHVHFVTNQAIDLIGQVNGLTAHLNAMRASSSWLLTAPLRIAVRKLKRTLGRGAPGGLPAPQPVVVPPIPEFLADELRPSGRSYARPLREVHQYHSDSSTGDAITASMMLIRRKLREAGYISHIYVENRAPALERELRLLSELPPHDQYVLIVHHSMGQKVLNRILALPVAKVLMYHNITPPRHLGSASLREAARVGREQLAAMQPHVAAALADSEFNATELRALGFDPVRVCTLLFDVEALRAAPAPAGDSHPFTVLFVGRVTESKGQLALVEAFALFVNAFGPARLILVGRQGGPEDSYGQALRAAIRRLDLDAAVLITGPVSDAERDRWYAEADLYVSLSQHEGFGVPLVEAMAKGVPVIAWPVGGVADTLGSAGLLLDDPAPAAAAHAMLELARDPARRERMTAAGYAALHRFDLGRHLSALYEALIRAGGALPPDVAGTEALAADLRFAVSGHVNGSYSLAAVNRDVVAAIERVRPGRVRLLPVEGGPIDDLSGVPEPERASVTQWAGRSPPESGPEVLISQHYPVLPPPVGADLPLAFAFWEESVVPAATVAALSEFRGVLAPSRFVAKAMVDSGVAGPVELLGYAPPLDRFLSLGAEPRPRPAGARTVFLHVSSCFPRKGVDVLLAAYGRAFYRDDPVELVIKGHPNPHNDVEDQIRQFRAADAEAPSVRYIGEDLDTEGLLALYRTADAMVLPTRGEGYNLPCAEALAAGIPLIVTGFGGHLDFCGPAEARLLQWRFALSRSHVATSTSVWADPDADDLSNALREVVADPEMVQARARRGRGRIMREADQKAFVDRLAAISARLMRTAPSSVAPVRLAWISSWGVKCGVAEYSRLLLPRLGFADVSVLRDIRVPDGIQSAVAGVVPQSVWDVGAKFEVEPVLAALRRSDPQVTMIQHQPGLIPWPALGELLRRAQLEEVGPTVVTLHSTRHLLAIDGEDRAVALDGMRTATRVLVHTLEDLNRLREFGLVDNVCLLPHGTIGSRPARPVRPLTAPGEQVVIGSFGFLLPGKGLPQLIAAVAMLRAQWPGVRLRLVNAIYSISAASTQELEACKAAVARAGLTDVVEFHTAFLEPDQSLDLLATCDLLVLPYQHSLEAASGAVRIALAAGVPVAVTPLSLFDEAGTSVARLPGKTPDAIAEGISALLSQPEARSGLVAQAAEWVAARSWEGVGTRLGGMLRHFTA